MGMEIFVHNNLGRVANSQEPLLVIFSVFSEIRPITSFLKKFIQKNDFCTKLNTLLELSTKLPRYDHNLWSVVVITIAMSSLNRDATL